MVTLEINSVLFPPESILEMNCGDYSKSQKVFVCRLNETFTKMKLIIADSHPHTPVFLLLNHDSGLMQRIHVYVYILKEIRCVDRG